MNPSVSNHSPLLERPSLSALTRSPPPSGSIRTSEGGSIPMSAKASPSWLSTIWPCVDSDRHACAAPTREHVAVLMLGIARQPGERLLGPAMLATALCVLSLVLGMTSPRPAAHTQLIDSPRQHKDEPKALWSLATAVFCHAYRPALKISQPHL